MACWSLFWHIEIRNQFQCIYTKVVASHIDTQKELPAMRGEIRMIFERVNWLTVVTWFHILYPVAVTFESVPDIGAVENASYIEAINYFCEMELEKMLDRLRGGSTGRPSNKSTANKNTVLVLPKIQR